MRAQNAASSNGRAGRPALETGTPRASLSEPLLRPAQAADLLSVRTSWIYEAVRARRLPCVRVGRHVRFLRSDLERWVDDQRDE